MLARYERLLALYPMRVKSLLGCSASFAGDTTAQAIEQYGVAPERQASGHFEYDHRRGAALTSLGTFWNGPVIHLYFGALERMFPRKPSELGALARKTAFNQLVMNPFVYLPLFYLWTGACAGLSAQQMVDKAQAEYLSTLLAAWGIFTPANLVNFHFVPLRHQQAFHLAVSYIYNTAMSLLAAPRRLHGQEP